MNHNSNYEKFKKVFYLTIKGEYELNDIHDLYVAYKEQFAYYDAKQFLKEFLQDRTKSTHDFYFVS